MSGDFAVREGRDETEAARTGQAARGRSPARAEPAAIEVSHLTKVFGGRTAVSDVSFSVAAGEVFGFLGPNGAGKTTTVRILGTLISPTAGSATVAGIPVGPAGAADIRRRISVMPEFPGLYLRLTVTENLEYFARLYGLPRRQQRLTEALAAVGLAGRAHDLAGSLSKGLRQRAALARSLLNEPAVMFLDEPTSGLDPVAAHEVHGLIAGLRNRGVTVFLTTHRLEEAERLCDRVAIMSTSLRTIGRPEDLRAELFTASLEVTVAAALPGPGRVFGGLPAVQGWRAAGPPGGGPAGYALTVSDVGRAAPAVTRALVAAGADVLSIAQSRHTLEDVYLQLVGEDGGAVPVSASAARIGAVIRKELAELRRNRLIVGTAAMLPVIFLVVPTVSILTVKASALSAGVAKGIDRSLFLPLIVPVLVPSMMSAFAVVGEREQGTLEPVLTTPVSRAELLIGKAAAIFIPAAALGYLIFGAFVGITQLAAAPAVAAAVWHAPQLPATLIFIPLLAAWGIWVGLAISARVSDTRVAQQLSSLGSLPAAGVAALMSFQVIGPTFGLAAALAGGLLAVDCAACLVVARLFDRERLITGARPSRGVIAPAAPQDIRSPDDVSAHQ